MRAGTPGSSEARPERGVTEERHDFRREVSVIPRPEQESRLAVLDDEGQGGGVRGNDGAPGRVGFERRDAKRLIPTREDKDRGVRVRRKEIVARDPAEPVDAARNPKVVGKAFERGAVAEVFAGKSEVNVNSEILRFAQNDGESAEEKINALRARDAARKEQDGTDRNSEVRKGVLASLRELRGLDPWGNEFDAPERQRRRAERSFFLR